MAFNVGIPIMKCSLNPSQTVNAKTGKKSKTCQIEKAWNEMNDERIGRDESIDKSLTYKNVWMEGSTQDDVVGIIQKEIDRVNTERHEAGLKSMRKDSVTTLSFVEKPNMEYMKDVSYEERVKFLQDSHKTMNELIHKWNPNWRIIESVQHHDEFGGLSPHNHSIVLIPTVDENGVALFNAKKEITRSFFSFINKNYPSMMRKMGYDVSDCRTYDQLTEEEKEERKLNPPEHGLSAQAYKQKHMKELAEDYKQILTENKELKAQIVKKDTLIETLREEVKKYKDIVEDLKSKLSMIAQKVGAKLMRALGLDVPTGTPSYPTDEVNKVIRDMEKTLKTYDTQKLRIIPDSDDKKNYRVAVKNEKGDYVTLAGGFVSRDLAEKYKKNMSEAARGLNITNAHGIKNGIS